MTYNDIRKSFLDYFASKGHKIVPSASLIPNDPTLLFTVAGMVPWKGILQGTEPAFAPRVADCQKCIRAGGKHNDLEDVGFDGRHHTFFEMLGNWSFGDYFKQDAIEMSWELLTRVWGLDPERIVVTTHQTDDEATEIWKKVAGKDAIRLGDKSNWWAAGDTGPCGPCTEMFYDFGPDIPGGLPGTPDEDGGRYVEIWNDVFMQFDRDANGNLTPLPKQNVDTGAGLERVASILQGKLDNYDTDLFMVLRRAVTELTGVSETPENRPSFKIICDHLRCVGFAIADGIEPSNEGRGYVIRRILRRAMRHGQILGEKDSIKITQNLLSGLYPALCEQMGSAYPELICEKERVVKTIENEENSFASMLENGMKLLRNEVHELQSLTISGPEMAAIDNPGERRPKDFARQIHENYKNNSTFVFPGRKAFQLYDTYGFPLDLTKMILKEKYDISVDEEEFNKAMAEQKERSRADTKGTKTLWESRIDLPKTDDGAKYNVLQPGKPFNFATGKVLAILKDGAFVESADTDDEVEIALDRTSFYATMGGQTGDVGNMVKFTEHEVNNEIFKTPDMNVLETFPVDGIVVHKGKLNAQLNVGDAVSTFIDTNSRMQIARAHTAAHLLQAALRRVLGDSVEQRGSKVAPDSVRFDFSYPNAMTPEQKAAVEKLINEWIAADLPVETKFPATVDEAKAMGAMALFGEKYEDGKIRAICVGDVSTELCGGTHAMRTSEIKAAKINSEKSIASGIRRIKMSVGDAAK
ncbi:MAG: alanine--tRNA ligase [Rickettsiales bacterium]|jgi:alanyl-tRNA synthetase|nr:alanine--tRNA ligase [Rickettsiales bacterium]